MVWDFDGVLNVNPGGKVFPWIADLDRDVGISPDSFRRFLNVPGQRRDVLNGWCDLQERLSGWIEDEGHDITAEDFLAHWLTADDRPDAEAVSWLDACPGRKVIATNNPVSRAQYIRDRTSAGRVAERVFASGEMGVAKPSPGFFGQIERWAALPPPRILLIDDSAENCGRAQSRGWRVFRFAPETRDRLPGVLGL
ncbi:HAD family hydrolase [Palleronia sp.]|uniref:HAD family hydrolase n=1 Tax=Palleronia sp. TaxID=1940284 RepID=UPI0035C7ED54